MRITITISDTKARGWKYFLGLRYGNRAELETLIKRAITERVAEIAGETLQDENIVYAPQGIPHETP